MADGKAAGPDQPSAELLKLGKRENSTILFEIHRIIGEVWGGGGVPQQRKEATLKIYHNKKDRAECCNYRVVALEAHVSNVLLRIGVRI